MYYMDIYIYMYTHIHRHRHKHMLMLMLIHIHINIHIHRERERSCGGVGLWVAEDRPLCQASPADLHKVTFKPQSCGGHGVCSRRSGPVSFDDCRVMFLFLRFRVG